MGLKQSYGKIKPFTQYVQTGEKVISNTLVETSFFNGDHYGSHSIPDKYDVGNILKVQNIIIDVK